MLVARPWPLPSDREIPGYYENLESKVSHALQSWTRPVPLNWLQLAAVGVIPVRSFIYRAPECLEPGLSLPGVQRSTNWATGRAKSIIKWPKQGHFYFSFKNKKLPYFHEKLPFYLHTCPFSNWIMLSEDVSAKNSSISSTMIKFYQCCHLTNLKCSFHSPPSIARPHAPL